MARAVTVEAAAPETAGLSRVLARALVFDDIFSGTQILLLQQWALQTPHWMLANSAHDEQEKARHRIWGASYVQALRRNGWSGLPRLRAVQRAHADRGCIDKGEESGPLNLDGARRA
jgi:hypothetical protein